MAGADVFDRAPLHHLSGFAMLNTILTLLVFQTIGEGLVYALGLPVPGPVIGMVLLLGYLVWKKDEAVKLAPTSSKLLAHMSLLFIPASVGIIVHIHRIIDEWIPIAVALIVSTVASMMVTAAVIRKLKKAD
jgi:holin-like protein